MLLVREGEDRGLGRLLWRRFRFSECILEGGTHRIAGRLLGLQGNLVGGDLNDEASFCEKGFEGFVADLTVCAEDVEAVLSGSARVGYFLAWADVEGAE